MSLNMHLFYLKHSMSIQFLKEPCFNSLFENVLQICTIHVLLRLFLGTLLLHFAKSSNNNIVDLYLTTSMDLTFHISFGHISPFEPSG